MLGADEGPDPGVAVNGATKLKEREGPPAWSGPYSSANVLAGDQPGVRSRGHPGHLAGGRRPTRSSQDQGRRPDQPDGAPGCRPGACAGGADGPASCGRREGQDSVDRRRSTAPTASNLAEVVRRRVGEAGREDRRHRPRTGTRATTRPEVKKLTAKRPDAYVFFDNPGTFGRMVTQLIGPSKTWKANKTWARTRLADPAFDRATRRCSACAASPPGAPDDTTGRQGLRPALHQATKGEGRRVRPSTPRRSTLTSSATSAPSRPARRTAARLRTSYER